MPVEVHRETGVNANDPCVSKYRVVVDYSGKVPNPEQKTGLDEAKREISILKAEDPTAECDVVYFDNRSIITGSFDTGKEFIALAQVVREMNGVLAIVSSNGLVGIALSLVKLADRETAKRIIQVNPEQAGNLNTLIAQVKCAPANSHSKRPYR
jgi:hypothetical protein